MNWQDLVRRDIVRETVKMGCSRDELLNFKDYFMIIDADEDDSAILHAARLLEIQTKKRYDEHIASVVADYVQSQMTRYLGHKMGLEIFFDEYDRVLIKLCIMNYF